MVSVCVCVCVCVCEGEKSNTAFKYMHTCIMMLYIAKAFYSLVQCVYTLRKPQCTVF